MLGGEGPAVQPSPEYWGWSFYIVIEFQRGEGELKQGKIFENSKLVISF